MYFTYATDWNIDSNWGCAVIAIIGLSDLLLKVHSYTHIFFYLSLIIYLRCIYLDLSVLNLFA